MIMIAEDNPYVKNWWGGEREGGGVGSDKFKQFVYWPFGAGIIF